MLVSCQPNRMHSLRPQLYNTVHFEYHRQCRVSPTECIRYVHDDIILSILSISINVVLV